MIFFSVERNQTEKLRKNKSCENVSPGYNDFTSRRFRYGKGSKKTLKGAMSVGGHGDGVGVKFKIVLLIIICLRFTTSTF